jgi:serine/threonine-protein kinase
MEDRVIGGRYRVLQPLGGTMAEVFLAEDTELGRPVVVKLLGLEADKARFEREARAAASLGHENIVTIYAYGEDAGRPYMVFEHLAGGSLEDRLREGPLPDEETRRVARDIAAGLAHAHARGLVHRDLKPANILFDEEGRAKIADFGIARLGGAGTLTEAGTVLGTAAYISPEQAAGEPATPASDVYSFGVLLFRMLTGALPFSAEQPVELLRLHRTAPAPSVADFRDDVPARLESLVAAALAKDPADRPPDGAALLAELGEAGGEATTILAPAAAPLHRRRVAPVLVAVALVLLAAAGVGIALLATRDDSHGALITTASSTTTRSTRSTAPAAPAQTERPTTEEHKKHKKRKSVRATTKQRETTPPPATTQPPPDTAITTDTLPVTTAATVPGGPDG